MRRLAKPLVVVLPLALLTAACGDTYGERALSGGAIGAGVGAAAGVATGGLSVLGGALLGGAVGAGVGVGSKAIQDNDKKN